MAERTGKKLVKGLPYENGGETGRIGLDIYRKDPNIVYALVQHEKGGIYRSEDKGETWKKMSDTDPRPSYYSQVRVDPNNDLRDLGCWRGHVFSPRMAEKTFSTRRVQKIHGELPRAMDRSFQFESHHCRKRWRHSLELRQRQDLGFSEQHRYRPIL